jgi:hypothetical protein
MPPEHGLLPQFAIVRQAILQREFECCGRFILLIPAGFSGKKKARTSEKGLQLRTIRRWQRTISRRHLESISHYGQEINLR